MTVDPRSLRALVATVAAEIVAHADELTALDSAIGDADHGINMKRGAQAVLDDLDAIAAKPLADALKAIGTKLVMTVGGASGPLYGTLFLSFGRELASVPDGRAMSAGDIGGAMMNAVDAMAARGKSILGQKTMLDVLYPTAEALKAGKSGRQIVAIADAAAEATIPVRAQRGRASFLGDRSIGHMDPGARSSALIVAAIARTLETHP